MKKIFTLLFSLVTFINCFGQAEIRGEVSKNFFSEDFIDVNQNFPITSKSDNDFWGTYVDGYYYMERYIERQQAVLCKHKATPINYSIKARLQLGPASSNEETVGLLFSIQPGGAGGFIFEFNRKKRFRVRDLKGNLITPDDGWVKSKQLDGVMEYEKLEIKCFNYRYELFIDDEFVFAFEDKRYQGGRFGVFLGPLAKAKMDFISVYEINIPGVQEAMATEAMEKELQRVKLENEKLKEDILLKRYKTEDVAAAKAIKILESQIEMLRIENNELQSVVKDYENNPTSFIDSTMEETLEFHTNKIVELTEQRDSIEQFYQEAKSKMNTYKASNDSLVVLNNALQNELDSIRKANQSLEQKVISTNEEWVDLTEEETKDKKKENDTNSEKQKKSNTEMNESEQTTNEKIYKPLEAIPVPVKKSKIKNY